METTRAGWAAEREGAGRPDRRLAFEGSVEEDPSALLRAQCPIDKPAADRGGTRAGLKSVSAWSRRWPAAWRTPEQDGLASLLKILWGGEYEDERDARFTTIGSTPISRRTVFSSSPASQVGSRRRTAADDRRCRRSLPGADDQATGGQRIDLLGIRKEDLPRSADLACLRVRLRKPSAPQDLWSLGLLPLRPGGQHSLGIAIEERSKASRARASSSWPWPDAPQLLGSLVKDVGAGAVEGVGGRSTSVAPRVHIRKATCSAWSTPTRRRSHIAASCSLPGERQWWNGPTPSSSASASTPIRAVVVTNRGEAGRLIACRRPSTPSRPLVEASSRSMRPSSPRHQVGRDHRSTMTERCYRPPPRRSPEGRAGSSTIDGRLLRCSTS